MSSHTLQQGDLRKDEIMALVRKLTVHSLWNTPEIRTSLTQAQREAVLDAMRQQREYGYSLEQVIKSDKKWLSDVEADYQDWDKHRNSSYKSWRVEIIKSLQSPFLRERNKKVGEGAGKAMLQSGEEGHRMFGPDASSTYIFPKELEQNPDALYPWVRSFIQDRIEYLESLQAQGYR